jgi:hypothetical protein
VKGTQPTSEGSPGPIFLSLVSRLVSRLVSLVSSLFSRLRRHVSTEAGLCGARVRCTVHVVQSGLARGPARRAIGPAQVVCDDRVCEHVFGMMARGSKSSIINAGTDLAGTIPPLPVRPGMVAKQG